MPSTDTIAAPLIEEAADWMLRLVEGKLSPAEQAAFEQWRNRSPAHVTAWQRAQSVLGAFEAVPAGMRGQAVKSLRQDASRHGRRAAVRRLAVLVTLGPAAWLAWREHPWTSWLADAATTVGEQRRMTLTDGTTLMLNTGTAVRISFSAERRTIRLLQGEIMISTGHEASTSYRPFVVETDHAGIRALGTRFTVRVLDEQTRVAVLQDAVEVTPQGAARAIRVNAGESAIVDAGHDTPVVRRSVGEPSLWERGLLLAQEQPLPALLHELSRYRSGIIRCHPDLADIKVSGTFSIRDTDASLRLLSRTLPLRIVRHTRWWISVEPDKDAG